VESILFIAIAFLINSFISYKITNMQPKIKSRIFKRVKMHYLNLIEGKKAEFDKKAMPILFGFMIIALISFNILLYVVYNCPVSITSIIAEILIIISMIIIWKAFNKEISVYLCDDGIYYSNKFISWKNIENVKKDDGFIVLFGKKKKILGRKLYLLQRIYLKYDEEIENIIKNQIEKFRDKA